MRPFATAFAMNLLSCIALILFAAAPSLAAITRTVTSLADDSTGSLRETISDADSGDTIVFKSDLAPAGGTATITLDSALRIEKDLTIQGPTAYTLIITIDVVETPLFAIFDSSYHDSNNFPIKAPKPDQNDLDNGPGSGYWQTVTLKNLHMQGAYVDVGGAIMALLSEVTCDNCTFTNNRAIDSGAAVFAQLCFLHFSGCSFTNNHAVYTGDAIYAGACALDFTNCTFSGNGGSEAGGSIFAEMSHLQLTSSTFTGNNALFSGGAVYSADSNVTVTSCTFSGNTVAYSGNGNDNARLDLPPPSDIFTDGGALTLTYGTLTLNNSTFSNNTCSNTSAYTGAYSCGGVLSVVGTLTADSCIFEQNTCSSTYYTAFGGALSIVNDSNDSLTLKNCSFNSNSVLSGSACGGAIDCDAIAGQTIENCSFISNRSQNHGGALYLRGTSSLNCTNTTFYNNTAVKGSVLYAAADAVVNTLRFVFDTIVDNTASSGNAISLKNATVKSVTLTNTLLTNTDSSGADLSIPGGTPLTLSGGNFIGSISGIYTDTYAYTDYASEVGSTSSYLQLSPLRTLETTPARLQVLIPLLDSPVCDAAIPCSVTTDARGVSRPQLDAWDSGAIEAVRADFTLACLPPLAIALLALLLAGLGAAGGRAKRIA